ncbi:MAG: CusA/CzcA family heavy metal efflux RND transporter [Candidatus Celaenobacter polaris]|nr:CusA/CzcA family heavy metal efflux RND transporter [Candidatus Celaenobacter polaris]
MLNRIIEFSIKNRLFVIIIIAIIIGIGFWSMTNTPVDAIPDLSDVQVIIFSEFAGQDPQVVEEQVTYPLTSAMLSVPFAKNIRGYSFFGFSMVYVIFEDGTDIYWARSRVLEYLNVAQGKLPKGVNVQLGPDATGVGWVYMYTLTSDKHDLQQLRSIQDWYLRYELMSVQGVAEVASAGGYVKQYQVEVDPEKLRAYGISLQKVNMAIKRSNNDVGGKLLEMGETEYMIRSKGYVSSIDDLKKIPVGINKESNTPIFLSQVADIHIGPELRRGIIDLNGEGEAVTGIIVMRYGENAMGVIKGVKEKLKELESGLPEGVKIITSYDRSNLIQRSINTLKSTLILQMLAVALISILFLLHFRSAFVAIFTLPVGILISLIIMKYMGISANIMSMGGIAIAIGVMVDASIVMVENYHKKRERFPEVSHQELVLKAAKEVGPALFFSLLIVTISFLPVFTLQQQEGRLFTPLAYTKTFAMGASAILAITIIPVLMFYFVKGKIRKEKDNPISSFFIKIYKPVIRFILRFPVLVLVLAVIILFTTLFPLFQIGSEFMPPLNEGDLLYMPTTPPGISITKAKELLQQTDKLIASHPQVAHTLGKIGRADTSTDPAPLSMIETTITLKDKKEWPKGKTIEDIIKELDEIVQFPGLTNSWTMPIKTRIDMLATGIKTPVGIKLMGEDLEQLSEIGEKIEALLRPLPDVLSAYSERVTGGNFIDINIDRERAAKEGLLVGDIQDVIKSAIGGINISWTVEGLERYPINVRYPRELRNNIDKLKRLTITNPMGYAVPLGQVADIEIVKGPPMIKSENARRTAWIYIDLKTSDVGGFVKEAKELIAMHVEIPDGVSMVWSGQFEYMERAAKRLGLVVPITLALIFLVLFMNFKNVTESLIMMLTVPFALVGGIWLMYFAGYNFSVATGVGFIALAGLAAENGVVLLVYLDEAFGRWKAKGKLKTLNDLKIAIMEGSAERVRPILMIVSTDVIGLLPIMFGTSTGIRVMKRIAAPMVGGLISSAVMTLVLLPTIYYLWKRNEINKKEK